MKKTLAFILALALILSLCACGAQNVPRGRYVNPSTGESITFRGGKATFEDKGTTHVFSYKMDGETIVIDIGAGSTNTMYSYDAATDTVYFNYFTGPIPFEKAG